MFVDVAGRDEVVQSLVKKLSCKVGKLPILYLELPIDGNPNSKIFWNHVVEKFGKKKRRSS